MFDLTTNIYPYLFYNLVCHVWGVRRCLLFMQVISSFYPLVKGIKNRFNHSCDLFFCVLHVLRSGLAHFHLGTSWLWITFWCWSSCQSSVSSECLLVWILGILKMSFILFECRAIQSRAAECLQQLLGWYNWFYTSSRWQKQLPAYTACMYVCLLVYCLFISKLCLHFRLELCYIV